MELLLELLDTTSEASLDVKASLSSINRIARALFGKEAGPVKDPKRSKKPKFFGVAHEKSIFKDAKGDEIKLTFDNSTDSGEFEINSLVPLKIVHGSPLDKAIRKLYKEHKVGSKKKTNYIVVGDNSYLREVHIGKTPHKHAVALVKDLIKLINKSSVSRELSESKAPEGDEPLNDHKLKLFPESINGWKKVEEIPDLLWEFLHKRHASTWYLPAYTKMIDKVPHFIVVSDNGRYYKTDGQRDFVGLYAMKQGDDGRSSYPDRDLITHATQSRKFAEFKEASCIRGLALYDHDDESAAIMKLASK